MAQNWNYDGKGRDNIHGKLLIHPSNESQGLNNPLITGTRPSIFVVFLGPENLVLAVSYLSLRTRIANHDLNVFLHDIPCNPRISSKPKTVES